MTVHLRPEEIEAESFRIIDMEAGSIRGRCGNGRSYAG